MTVENQVSNASRIVLVDYQHLSYKTLAAQPLSATVNNGGQIVPVDTTIPNYTIKDIFRMSGRGAYPIGIFFEGGNSLRKAYFEQLSQSFDITDGTKGKGYKGKRNGEGSVFYDGINLTLQLLLQGGVSCFRKGGKEADDLVISMVNLIKSVDSTTPIDVVTGDSDLLPLVDSQVSVYMRGKRQHAEIGSPELRLYFQVTPDTWDEFLSYTSAYKEYTIPYNSMLLFKLIRGDKTDEIPSLIGEMNKREREERKARGLKGKKITENLEYNNYGPVGYNKKMAEMLEAGVDFENTFKYGVDFDSVIQPVLEPFFTTGEIQCMKAVYEGLNPSFVNLTLPQRIDYGKLQMSLAPLRINL